MRMSLLLVAVALIVVAVTGCNSGDDSTTATVAPTVKKEAVPVTGPKGNGGPPVAGQATVGLNPNVDPNKFAPGSKSGGNN